MKGQVDPSKMIKHVETKSTKWYFTWIITMMDGKVKRETVTQREYRRMQMAD